MRRAVFFCIAVSIVVTASPSLAQQSTPDEPPPASELPPPVPRNATEAPPPFPHYPARAPREHDPNYRKSAHSHQRSKSHHQGKTHHRASTSHHAAKHHEATKHHHSTRQYFSKRTIRQCHRMTYQQIMKYKNCRTMMKQDIETAKHRPAHHRSTAHHHKTHRG